MTTTQELYMKEVHAPIVTAANNEKEQLEAKQKMQAEKQISKMEEELQSKQKEMSLLTDQFEQQQQQLEILQQKGEGKVIVTESQNYYQSNYYLFP